MWFLLKDAYMLLLLLLVDDNIAKTNVILSCNCTSINRFPHLLPYHGPEEHDHLSEEFLQYQTMPMPSLQDSEIEMESFWADMATRQHKVNM